MAKCYYFGVWEAGGAGHYLHEVGGRKLYRLESGVPFRETILDTGLIPPFVEDVEGVVYRSVINGWTVLTFFDRSGDSRKNSNSAFVMAGTLEFDDAMALARESFPSIFARFKFDLKFA